MSETPEPLELPQYVQAQDVTISERSNVQAVGSPDSRVQYGKTILWNC